MSDIVQKLRDRKQAVAWSRGQDTDYPTKWEEDVLCQKAAEEIEALRTSLAELITVCEQIVDAGHMNTEDLARLRAALEKQ